MIERVNDSDISENQTKTKTPLLIYTPLCKAIIKNLDFRRLLWKHVVGTWKWLPSGYTAALSLRELFTYDVYNIGKRK